MQESVPGEWDDQSIEVDLDVVHQRSADSIPVGMHEASSRSLSDLWPGATSPGHKVQAPDIILFDPMGFGIAEELSAMGFPFRSAQSGVDVMGLIAAAPTGLVLCGPSEDAERRRLLTAAVRVRFPHVPVVYVSTHAHNPEAVDGAKREGATSVIAIPFPARPTFQGILSNYVAALAILPPKPARPDPQSQRPGAHPAPPAPNPRAKFDDVNVPPTDSVLFEPTSDHISFDDFDDFEDAKTDAMEVAALEKIERDGAEHEASVVRHRQVPDGKGMWTFPEDRGGQHRADGARRKTEVVAMPPLEARTSPTNASALGPFLWGLDDALAWTEQKAREGHVEAITHARTLSSIRQIVKALAAKESNERKKPR